MPTFADALYSLCSKCKYTLVGDTYEGIQWEDVSKKPTKKEIEDELIRLNKMNIRNQYQKDRQLEYPPIEQQLDTMFHGGYDAWKEQIQAIKDKYPKPE